MKYKHRNLSVYKWRSRGGEERENNGSLPDLLTFGSVNLALVSIEGALCCKGSGWLDGRSEGEVKVCVCVRVGWCV